MHSTLKKIAIPLTLLIAIFVLACKVEHSSDKKQETSSTAATKSVYRIGVVGFGPDEAAEQCFKGLVDGLKELGFAEGKNLEIKRTNAQGEIANIPLLFQNYDGMGLDAIVPMTTPCLTAACTTVKKTPVVFTYVYDPVAAGAGKNQNDHLPFVTGTSSFPPLEDTLVMIQKVIPDTKSIGILYNPSEANSVKVISVVRELATKHNVKLEEVTVNNTSDVYPAAQSVASKNIQALWVAGDNTVNQSFDAMAKVSAESHIPLFTNDPEYTARGALMAVGITWYKSGRESAKKLAQVLKGESPAKIPFLNYVEKLLLINPANAKTLGITFPDDVLKQAEKL